MLKQIIARTVLQLSIILFYLNYMKMKMKRKKKKKKEKKYVYGITKTNQLPVKHFVYPKYTK